MRTRTLAAALLLAACQERSTPPERSFHGGAPSETTSDLDTHLIRLEPAEGWCSVLDADDEVETEIDGSCRVVVTEGPWTTVAIDGVRTTRIHGTPVDEADAAITLTVASYDDLPADQQRAWDDLGPGTFVVRGGRAYR